MSDKLCVKEYQDYKDILREINKKKYQSMQIMLLIVVF